MAQSLMLNYSNKMFFRTALAALGVMLSHVVMAQSLQDPTRPPVMLIEPSANPEALTGPVLQSILIAPNRHVAIISGQTVALNGKYGDQTLIKMTETEVVLRNGKELQILKLFPDFDKKLSRVGTK